MSLKKISLICCAIGLVQGCSILVPYEENFACEGKDDFGRCVSVSGAYEQAVTGVEQGEVITRDRKKPKKHDNPMISTNENPYSDNGRYQSYKESVYQELQGLIKSPQTPMMKKAEVVRTLVLNYQSEMPGSPLFMHRYVYFFGDDPKWVLGQNRHKKNEPMLPLIDDQ